jgi:flagellar basal body-associated protein FliL
MGNHALRAERTRGRKRGRRLLIPLGAGVVIFGAVTAFAATLNVSTKSLGSGNATVTSCNATAAVTYNTAYASTLPGYKVTTAPITTAATCTGLSYKVTLTGTGNASLAEVTGTLDASGAASPDFSASNIAAANVTGVSVIVTG